MTHSLVTPGSSPLHLTPRVTYSDQALHVALELNLQDTGSDGQLRTINIVHREGWSTEAKEADPPFYLRCKREEEAEEDWLYTVKPS